MVKCYYIAGSSNGRIVDSESTHLGSNPSPAATFRRCNRMIKKLLLLLVLILIGFLIRVVQPVEQVMPLPEKQDTFRVTKVIDGDTIEVNSNIKVRYIGIDAPESVDPRRMVDCFGKEASLENKKLVEGKEVRLEKDVSETDKFGRLLRYVYVNDTFVNDYLVRQGYALASTFPPDIKYQEQFSQAEREARENNRGLWSKCE